MSKFDHLKVQQQIPFENAVMIGLYRQGNSFLFIADFFGVAVSYVEMIVKKRLKKNKS